MTVTKLQAVKTEKVPNKELIADLQALLDKAQAGEIEGFLAIFCTDDRIDFDARLSAEKLIHQPPRAAPKLSPVRNGLPRLVTCLHQVEYLPHPCCVRMRKRAHRARLNGEDVDVHAL